MAMADSISASTHSKIDPVMDVQLQNYPKVDMVKTWFGKVVATCSDAGA
jgi:hypothetical protein